MEYDMVGECNSKWACMFLHIYNVDTRQFTYCLLQRWCFKYMHVQPRCEFLKVSRLVHASSYPLTQALSSK